MNEKKSELNGPGLPKTLPAVSASGQATVKIHELPYEVDPQLRSIWVDAMNIVCYKEASTATLIFQTAIMYPPNAMRKQEVARLQMTQDHVKKMIDVVCRHLGYYPEKDRKTPSKSAG